jgi:hypothetical protein
LTEVSRNVAASLVEAPNDVIAAPGTLATAMARNARRARGPFNSGLTSFQ